MLGRKPFRATWLLPSKILETQSLRPIQMNDLAVGDNFVLQPVAAQNCKKERPLNASATAKRSSDASLCLGRRRQKGNSGEIGAIDRKI
jgi:hypothetical protein